MQILPRLRPDPIPSVQYVPEYRADEAMAARYADMKSVLQVPWMGVVTMAYAHFPHFYDAFWGGLRELAASQEFVAAARSLRADMEAAVERELRPHSLVERLGAMGYSAHELDTLRAVPETLSHGNYLYTLLTSAARMLLEGDGLGAPGTVTKFEGSHAPTHGVPLVLMEAHHVDPDTRALYDDVKTTLRLPFLNTDYRACARWPSWFRLTWSDLKPHIDGAAHERCCDLYQRRTTELLKSLPNPAAVTPARIREAAQKDGFDDVLGVVRLFHHLHAGLMTNVAFFRAQLLDQNTSL